MADWFPYNFIFLPISQRLFLRATWRVRGPWSASPSAGRRTQHGTWTLCSLPHGLFSSVVAGDELALWVDGSHGNWEVERLHSTHWTPLYTLFTCHLLGLATRYKHDRTVASYILLQNFKRNALCTLS